MLKKSVILGFFLGSIALPTLAENRFSGELLLGTADQEFSDVKGAPTGESTSFGFRSGFLLSNNFTLEAGYQDYGEAENTFLDSFGDTNNDKLSSSALNIGVKGVLPINGDISLNSRVGLAFWEAELEHTDSVSPEEVFKIDDDGNDLYYGIGIQYDVNSKLFIGAEYNVTTMNFSENGISVDFDVKDVSLSLGFKF